MEKSFVGERVQFPYLSDGKFSLLTHWYAVLLPDCDPRLLKENEGIVIVEEGESDGIDTAVRLEDGRYALVHREIIPPDWNSTGPVHVTRSDNPAVTFAMWNGTGFPTPLCQASHGRQKWNIPRIGCVAMYYNEKKEEMNYEPDTLGLEDVQLFFREFGGWPIVLDPSDSKVFSVNAFLGANRLYHLGDAKGQFASHFLGDLSKVSEEKREEHWNRAVDPDQVIRCLPLLAWDMHRPIRVVTRGVSGHFERSVPIYGAWKL